MLVTDPDPAEYWNPVEGKYLNYSKISVSAQDLNMPPNVKLTLEWASKFVFQMTDNIATKIRFTHFELNFPV